MDKYSVGALEKINNSLQKLDRDTKPPPTKKKKKHFLTRENASSHP
jgi:hypothetical protein